METLETRITRIEQRNQLVETDKKWETSISRKVVIAVLTYGVIVVLFLVTKTADPYLNALVATLAFILSTLSLPLFKKMWELFVYNKYHE